MKKIFVFLCVLIFSFAIVSPTNATTSAENTATFLWDSLSITTTPGLTIYFTGVYHTIRFYANEEDETGQYWDYGPTTGWDYPLITHGFESVVVDSESYYSSPEGYGNSNCFTEHTTLDTNSHGFVNPRFVMPFVVQGAGQINLSVDYALEVYLQVNPLVGYGRAQGDSIAEVKIYRNNLSPADTQKSAHVGGNIVEGTYFDSLTGTFNSQLDFSDGDTGYFWLQLFTSSYSRVDTIAITEMAIDIKPSSDLNYINPRSHGKIPVAILSSIHFHAFDEIDKESLTFGHTGYEESLAFCNPTPEDVNADGFDDLLCHFYTQKTGIQCYDPMAPLRGQTITGVPISADDYIIVPPSCKD